MEKIDYKTLIKLVDKYEEEASRVFSKLKKADQEAKTDILQYGAASYFERVEWEESDENNICIRYYDYYYDLYDSSILVIPASILFNDEKTDKWIQGLITDALKKIEVSKRKAELMKEAKEMLEYERLKAKFGN